MVARCVTILLICYSRFGCDIVIWSWCPLCCCIVVYVALSHVSLRRCMVLSPVLLYCDVFCCASVLLDCYMLVLPAGLLYCSVLWLTSYLLYWYTMVLPTGLLYC